MPVKIRCENPGCRKVLKVNEGLMGRRVKCPGCGTAVRVAAPQPPAAPQRPLLSKPFRAPPAASPEPPPGGGRRAAAKRASPAVWLTCLTLAIASAIVAWVSHHKIEDMDEAVVTSAEYRVATDRWTRGGAGAFWQVQQEAHARVRVRLWPAYATWEFVFRLSLLLVCSLVVGEVVAFGLLLGRRGVRTVFRWYAGCTLTALAGAILVASTLLFAAYTKDRRSSDLGDTTEGWSANAPDAAERRQAAERRAQEYEARRQGRETALLIASRLFLVALVVACRALLGQVLAFCVLLYKLWVRVQDGAARTTPGQAVGLLFIPFFNIYWAFVALPGLADELNRCAYQRGLNVPPASRGLFLTYCILCFVAAVPVLGILVVVINCFIGVFAMRSAARVGAALEGVTGTECASC